MVSNLHLTALPALGLTLLLCLAGSGSAARAQDGLVVGGGFDLARVLDLAEQRNLGLRQAAEDVLAAEQEVRRRRAGLLPQVDLAGQQSRSQAAGLAVGNNPGGPDSRFFAGVEASLNLANASVLAEERLARFNRDLARLLLEDQRQALLDATARAFFTHLRNLAQLDVVDANLARDGVLLDLARIQFEAGVATPIDVTRAEVQLARDQQDRLQQETEVLASRLALARLLDLGLGDPVRLLPIAPTPPSNVELEALRVAARGARPDALVAQETLERNRFARRAAGWQRLPSARLFGDYGFGAREAWQGDYDDVWSFGLAMRMPLFDAGRIDANRVQAESAIRRQEFVVRDLDHEIEASLRLALQDVTSRYAQIGLARRTVELNREELRLARTRFQEGVADNRDVVTAQADLAAAEDLLVNAEYQYHLARVTLARLQGDVRLVTRTP